MNDFDFDAMQKKRIAGNARHMKNGSKSRRCSLPSDHMTHAQWKRRNGPVYTVSLNQPMSWDAFKCLTLDLQQAYIDAVQNRFGVPISRMSTDLFNKSNTNLRLHCARMGLKFDSMQGRVLTGSDLELWDNWCKGITTTEKCEDSHENEAEKCEEDPVEEEHELPEALIEMATKKLDVDELLAQRFALDVDESKLDLDELSAVFSGEFDPERFLRFMTQLPMPDGRVRIKVEVTKV